MLFVVRTDSSHEIGSGHVTRCLTLAQELRRHGAEVSFICRPQPGNLSGLVEHHGFELHLLPPSSKTSLCVDEQVSHGSWLGASWQEDSEQSQILIRSLGTTPDKLLVDHYALDWCWEHSMRAVIDYIVAIDDLADREHDCDLILDQNFHDQASDRYAQLVKRDCKMLCGPEYALLRPEFRQARKSLLTRDGSIRRILVFFGGSDLGNHTSTVLDAIDLLDGTDIMVDVVVGTSNPRAEEVRARCLELSQVEYHQQIPDIVDLMVKADLAIGAGGSALWERACLGLPTIAWAVADHQRSLLENLAAQGAILYPDEESLQAASEILVHINALLRNGRLVCLISQRCAQLTDGRGAQRVAQALLQQQVELRLAEQQDSSLIHEWRNHPNIRKYSMDGQPISVAEHRRWLESVREDKNIVLLIAETAGTPIGVLRFDFEGNQALVSIYVAPGMQQRGYGSQILAAGEKWLRQNHKSTQVITAEVLPENEPSRRMFERAKYEEQTSTFRKMLR